MSNHQLRGAGFQIDDTVNNVIAMLQVLSYRLGIEESIEILPKFDHVQYEELIITSQSQSGVIHLHEQYSNTCHIVVYVKPENNLVIDLWETIHGEFKRHGWQILPFFHTLDRGKE